MGFCTRIPYLLDTERVSSVWAISNDDYTTLESLRPAAETSRSGKSRLRGTHGFPGKGRQGRHRRSTGTSLRVDRDERNAKSLDHTS